MTKWGMTKWVSKSHCRNGGFCIFAAVQKVCVEVLEQLFRFQDEKSLRFGATELSKKESFVARNGGFCIFAAVHPLCLSFSSTNFAVLEDVIKNSLIVFW
jgi:hypothetical protein